jgi:hypothetical protein
MGVIRPNDRREGYPHLPASRGGGTQEPRRPLRSILHGCSAARPTSSATTIGERG